MHGSRPESLRKRKLRPNRWSVEWIPAALVAFYKLSVQAATTIDQAIIQFAESGRGHLEWVAPYYRLRIGSFDAPIVLDLKARTITVISIFRSSVSR